MTDLEGQDNLENPKKEMKKGNFPGTKPPVPYRDLDKEVISVTSQKVPVYKKKGDEDGDEFIDTKTQILR